MPKLKKVYIQDPNANSIRQSFEAVMDSTQTIMFKKSNVGDIVELPHPDQFIIPSELV